MDPKIVPQQQLRAAMDAEIAARTRAHQQKLFRYKTAVATREALRAAAPSEPLVILAHGDSWFDYPLDGNGISLRNTDIIMQLMTMGNVNPDILNVSQWGDAATAEMSWPKQQRMINALQDPANWLASGKPDAILFSGGGNDIAGDQFCIFVDYAVATPSGLDRLRFDKALGLVEACYLDLFQFRDRFAPDVPIFGHSYDFPVPNGAHPICAGPWLKPSLDFCGYNVTQGTQIVRQALLEFANLLKTLAAVPANKFFLIETQGTLQPGDWANELHPYPEGFIQIADKFVSALRAHFPGRI